MTVKRKYSGWKSINKSKWAWAYFSNSSISAKYFSQFGARGRWRETNASNNYIQLLPDWYNTKLWTRSNSNGKKTSSIWSTVLSNQLAFAVQFIWTTCEQLFRYWKKSKCSNQRRGKRRRGLGQVWKRVKRTGRFANGWFKYLRWLINYAYSYATNVLQRFRQFWTTYYRVK